MKNFFKDYLMNILFGMIFLVLLLCAFMSLFDWIINPLFWVTEGIFLALTFCLPKHSKDNKDKKDNKDEEKEFKTFTKFKVSIIVIMILISIYLLIKTETATGWDALGYGIFWIISLLSIMLILITNFIIRIYYRIKYHQKFAKGAISNLIFVIMLLLILFCVLLIFSNM